MKKAVTYARESPSLAEKELPVESQNEAMAERVKQDNNILDEVYIDNGYAGDLLDRPDLDRLRDDAAQHKFEVLYIHDRDRLARKYWLQELVIEEIEELGIEVTILEERKAETDEDRILQGVRGLFAEYERAKIRERTRRGRLHRAKKGLLVGTESPYGYRYVRPSKEKEERWYEIVEKQAKVVRMIFSWLAYEGLSLRGVVKRLYESKIPSPTGNPIWAFSTLGRLVRNETYIGVTYYNKTYSLIPAKPINNGYKRMKKTSRKYKQKEEWIAIQVPAILDEDTFYLAQAQLNKNMYLTRQDTKYRYLLRGLSVCRECESRLAGDGLGHDGVLRYRCTNRLRRFPLRKTCHSFSVRADKLETKVYEAVVDLIQDPSLLTEQVGEYNKQQESQKENFDQKIIELTENLEKLATEESRLVVAYKDGVIDLDNLKSLTDELNHKRADIKDEIEKASAQKAESVTESQIFSVKNFCQKVSNAVATFDWDEKEKLLHLLITQIIIGGGQGIIKGAIPADSTQTDQYLDYVSKDNIGSRDRLGRTADNRGSRYSRAIPPSLQYRRSS